MKMKTEAYYCVGGPIGKIKGTLTISNNLIYFEPNSNLMSNLNGKKIIEFLETENVSTNVFQCSIDYTDIVSIQKLRGMNKTAEYVEDYDDKKCYLYDFYIQINVSQVNGNFLEAINTEDTSEGGSFTNSFDGDNTRTSDIRLSQKKKLQHSIIQGRKQKHTYEKAIASVFFRFSHRNFKNKVLNNQEQIAVVEQIINQI